MIEKLTSEISEQEDLLATTIAEIKGLTESIAALNKMVHETTEERKAQHQEFVDMFATSATAIRLVSKAITRLEKFYSPEKFAAAKKAAELLPGGFDAFLQKSSSTLSLSKFRTAVRN